jgi:hypothetical protein
MIATVFHWMGALLMLAAMWAALRADGRPVDLSSGR